jgi:hypothetical protein
MDSEELLKEISAKIDEVRDWQTRQTVVCEQRGDLLSDMKTTIWGNGKPGLETRVERIETYSKAAKIGVKAGWAVALALGTLVGAIATHLL